MIEGLVRSESGKIHLADCEKVKQLKEPLPVPRERALERYRWGMCCFREIDKLIAYLGDAGSS